MNIKNETLGVAYWREHSHPYVASLSNENPRCIRCDLPAEDGIHPRITTDKVDHPSHYGGADNPYEAIKVIEAWNLGFCLGNAIKYISRAGKKSTETLLDDLKKARWYIDREISRLEKK